MNRNQIWMFSEGIAIFLEGKIIFGTNRISKHVCAMDVPEGAFAYGAYAYGPGVGLRIASDYYCEGKKS